MLVLLESTGEGSTHGDIVVRFDLDAPIDVGIGPGSRRELDLGDLIVDDLAVSELGNRSNKVPGTQEHCTPFNVNNLLACIPAGRQRFLYLEHGHPSDLNQAQSDTPSGVSHSWYGSTHIVPIPEEEYHWNC